jgi:hypothetical protein
VVGLEPKNDDFSGIFPQFHRLVNQYSTCTPGARFGARSAIHFRELSFKGTKLKAYVLLGRVLTQALQGPLAVSPLQGVIGSRPLGFRSLWLAEEKHSDHENNAPAPTGCVTLGKDLIQPENIGFLRHFPESFAAWFPIDARASPGSCRV